MSSGRVLSSYQYTYNFDGNQASKTDHTGRTDNYTYDNLVRLKTEVVTGVEDKYDTTYTYDFAGNRIKKYTKDKQDVEIIDEI